MGLNKVEVVISKLKGLRRLAQNGRLSAQDVSNVSSDVFRLIEGLAKRAREKPWWAKTLVAGVIQKLVGIVLRLEVLSMLIYFGVRPRIQKATETICEAAGEIEVNELKEV